MKRTFITTFLLLFALLPVQAKHDNEKHVELETQFKQNAFNPESITVPTLMTGSCYQSDEWGQLNNLNHAAALLYPYQDNIYWYGRPHFHSSDESHQAEYQDFSTPDAIVNFVDKHPMDDPTQIAGVIRREKGERHMLWLYPQTAMLMVQKNPEQFIVAVNFGFYSTSYCELTVRPDNSWSQQ